MNDSSELARESCESCGSEMPCLSEDEARRLLLQIPDWELKEKEGVLFLWREYRFSNFQDALNFTNLIGRMAEERMHHPDILTAWGRVTLTWYTHKIGGLHRNDFRCAAQSDLLYELDSK